MSPLGAALSHTLHHTRAHSGGGVILIDVQRLGPLSAAGAGNCFHPSSQYEAAQSREEERVSLLMASSRTAQKPPKLLQKHSEMFRGRA